MSMNRRHFVSATAAAFAASIAWSPLEVLAGTAAQGARAISGRSAPEVLFGVDYYPDQTPEQRWEEDAVQMRAFGVNSVRIAEFAWALMEPSEGSYHFDWLHRAVEILHAQNISVMLGTPSAAPPPWLTQKYREVLMVNREGLTLSPGARRFTCPTNKTYRRLSVNIATQMAREFAAAPGIIGWQIDNELTLGPSPRCYCQYCRTGFQEWLKSKYGSLKDLNEAWGTVFWSNTYTDFSQIPVPLPSGAPPNPGFALDYDRYQSYANATFMQDQLNVLRQLCPHHFVTTNNVSGPAGNLDLRELCVNLDFVAYDNYPGFTALIPLLFGSPIHGAGAEPPALETSVSFGLDSIRGAKNGAPFFVMEQQSGKSGQPSFSPQPEPGQLRLWSYQTIAHGAFGIHYFRWDSATYGAEEYWHGILTHDRQPSPGFAEIKDTIRELKALGSDALYARCDTAIALCQDPSAAWALEIQPGHPNLTYSQQMLAWYAPLSASQAGVAMVDGVHDLTRYKVVCAPAMYVVTPEQADAIGAFVRQGGTFIAGFRLGVKDRYSRIVSTPLPGLMRDIMGVEVTDYEPLYSQPQAVAFIHGLAGPDAKCNLWADILKPGPDTEVLATYSEGQYKGQAAITAHTYGRGRAIYLAAGLDAQDLARVLTALLASAGVRPNMKAAPGVEVATRSTATQRWTYILNHTAMRQAVELNGSYRSYKGGEAVSGTISLPPYGVEVLVSKSA